MLLTHALHESVRIGSVVFSPGGLQSRRILYICTPLISGRLKSLSARARGALQSDGRAVHLPKGWTCAAQGKYYYLPNANDAAIASAASNAMAEAKAA